MVIVRLADQSACLYSWYRNLSAKSTFTRLSWHAEVVNKFPEKIVVLYIA